MRYISLFTGIGGFDEGLRRAGWKCAGQVELDSFCQRVLERRFPGVRRVADVRRVSRQFTDEPVELVVGGFPCQDLSVAGKRAGLGGARSGLFWEITRIAKTIKPTWGLFENVAGLLSSHRGRDFWLVLQGLRECWPAVGWRVLDSRHFGVAQRRRRLFLVGGPTETRVAQVLALAEGSPWGLAASHEAWPAVAAGARGGADVDRALGWGEEHGIVNQAVSTKWAKGTSGPAGNEYHNLVHVSLVADPISASEDKTYTHEGKNNFRLHNVVAYRKAQKAHHPEDGERWEEDDLTDTITDLDARTAMAIVEPVAVVRRLTPLECERLQGFPDGWTCLCQPLEAYAVDSDGVALRCICPDQSRYMAIGNAVTVAVIEEIGRRLLQEGAH